MGGIDWGGVAVGFLGILVGAWYSRKANKEAREASGEAKEANEKADQANKIAGQSLEEAREANRLTRDTIEAQRQPDIVEWICQWDTEKRLLTIRNVGESVAKQVTVTVWDDKGRLIHRVRDLNWDTEQWEDKIIPLALPDMSQLIREGEKPALDEKGREIRYMDGSWDMDGKAHYVLHVRISWTDSFGAIHSQKEQSPEINK